jgi:hypothetical protein
MIKHIGRHGEERVVVVFNTVPGEDHMALVVYSSRLPSSMHDEVMKVLESPSGQQAKSLSDALHRNIGIEGISTLSALHKGGYIKKVQTKQIILTPNNKTNIRLDELNDILAKMEKGEEAVKQMAELDNSRGFADNKKIDRIHEVGEPTPSADGILSDADIAKSRLEQATKYRAEAEGLITEAKRLEQEAKELTPKAKNVRKTTTKEKA